MFGGVFDDVSLVMVEGSHEVDAEGSCEVDNVFFSGLLKRAKRIFFGCESVSDGFCEVDIAFCGCLLKRVKCSFYGCESVFESVSLFLAGFLHNGEKFDDLEEGLGGGFRGR